MLPLDVIAVLGVLFAFLVNAMVRIQLAGRLLIGTEQEAEKGAPAAEEEAC